MRENEWLATPRYSNKKKNLKMSEEVTTPSGLKYTVSETGEGEKVGVNKKVKVYYYF